MKTRIAARSVLRPATCEVWYARSFPLRIAKCTAQCGQNRPLHSTSAAFRASLFRLQNAQIPQLKDGTGAYNTLSIDIQDGGKEEAWAITGPAAEKGGAAKAAVVKALLGLTRVEQRTAEGGNRHHLNCHPFLRDTPLTASQAMQLVSFSARLSSVGTSAASNDFVDFSTRYGAIRDEDRVTVFESLMKAMGTPTGLVARMAHVHDALVDPEQEKRQDAEEGLLRLPWASDEAEMAARATAKENLARLERLAPMLNLSHGDPPLLQRPMIALSNGQTRRARILSALCVGCEVLVLEEPFTGLDPPTRKSLSKLLGELHAARQPRVVCVLREQDELPPFVTHLLSIGDEGEVLFMGPLSERRVKAASQLTSDGASQQQAEDTRGGYEAVKRCERQGMGRGDEAAEPIVRMNDVTIDYKGKVVLDSISLHLPPGSTTILVGDNGSGKTTLLSLLLGSHPRSYALAASSLTLFGYARSDPPNATLLLSRRSGQLSPELANAFPRKGLDRGGMSVGDAVASGFDGIFSRRPRSEDEWTRVKELLLQFQSVLTASNTSHRGAAAIGSSKTDDDGNINRLIELPFVGLSPGSQAVVLFLRSIVHRPRLLVLDEPFQGMSSRQVKLVRDFLDGRTPDAEASSLEKQWREEMAVVIVSHFEEEWPSTAGRLIRLSDGKVVEAI